MAEDKGVESRFEIDWESATDEEYIDLYGSLAKALGRQPMIKDLMDIPHGPSFATLTRVWGSPDAFLEWGAEQQTNRVAETTQQHEIPQDSMDYQTTKHYEQPLEGLESALSEQTGNSGYPDLEPNYGLLNFDAVRSFAFELRYKREQEGSGRITRKVWKEAGGPPIATVRSVFCNPDHATCWEAMEADYQVNREAWLAEVRRGTSVIPARSGTTEPMALIADTMSPEEIARVKAKIDEQGYGALVTPEGTYRPEPSPGVSEAEAEHVERTMRGMGENITGPQNTVSPRKTRPVTELGMGLRTPSEEMRASQEARTTQPGLGEMATSSQQIQDAYDSQAVADNAEGIKDEDAYVDSPKDTIPGMGEMLTAQPEKEDVQNPPKAQEIGLSELAKHFRSLEEETSPNRLKTLKLADEMNELPVYGVESAVLTPEEATGETPKTTTIDRMADMLSVAGAKSVREEANRQQSPSTEFFSVAKHVAGDEAKHDEGLPPLPGEKTRIGGGHNTEVSGLISADYVAPPSNETRHDQSVTWRFDTTDKDSMETNPEISPAKPSTEVQPVMIGKIDKYTPSELKAIREQTAASEKAAQQEGKPKKLKVEGIDAIVSSPVPRKESPAQSDDQKTNIRIIAAKDKPGYQPFESDGATPTPTPTPAGEVAGRRLEEINNELARQETDSKEHNPAAAKQARSKKIVVGAGIGATALALAGVLGVALAPNQVAQDKLYSGKTAETKKNSSPDGGILADALQKAVAALNTQQDPPALPSNQPPTTPPKQPVHENTIPASHPTYDGKDAQTPATKPVPSAGGGKDWEERCRNAAFAKAVGLVKEDHPESVVPQYNLPDGKISRQGVANTAYWHGTRVDDRVDDWTGGAGDGKQHDAANAYVRRLTGKPLSYFTRNRAVEFTSKDIDPQKVDPGMVSECAGKPEEKHGSLRNQNDAGKTSTNIALAQLNLYQSWLNGEIQTNELEKLAVQNGLEFSWLDADSAMAERAEYLANLSDEDFISCLSATEMRCFDKFHYMHVDGTELTDEQIMQSGINYSMPQMTRAQAEKRYGLLLARMAAEKKYTDSLEDLTEFALIEDSNDESGDGSEEGKELPLPLAVGLIAPGLKRRREDEEENTTVVVRDTLLSGPQYATHEPTLQEGVVVYDFLEILKAREAITDSNRALPEPQAPAYTEADIEAAVDSIISEAPAAEAAAMSSADVVQESEAVMLDAVVETGYTAPALQEAVDDDGWNLSSVDLSNYKPAEYGPSCSDAQAHTVAGLISQGLKLAEANRIAGTYIPETEIAELSEYVREDREADEFVENAELDRMIQGLVTEGRTNACAKSAPQDSIIPVQANMWSVYAENTKLLMHDMALIGKNADYINWIAAQHGMNLKVTEADVNSAVKEVNLAKLASGETANYSAKEAEEAAADLETIIPWEISYARTLESFERERRDYSSSGFVSINAKQDSGEDSPLTEEEHKQLLSEIDNLASETSGWEAKYQGIVEYFAAEAARDSMQKGVYAHLPGTAPEPLMRLASQERSLEDAFQTEALPETSDDASANANYGEWGRKWTATIAAEEKERADSLYTQEQTTFGKNLRELAFENKGYSDLLSEFESEMNPQEYAAPSQRMYTPDNAAVFVHDMLKNGKSIEEINATSRLLGIGVEVTKDNMQHLWQEGGLNSIVAGTSTLNHSERDEIQADLYRIINGPFTKEELETLFDEPAEPMNGKRAVAEKYTVC